MQQNYGPVIFVHIFHFTKPGLHVYKGFCFGETITTHKAKMVFPRQKKNGEQETLESDSEYFRL